MQRVCVEPLDRNFTHVTIQEYICETDDENRKSDTTFIRTCFIIVTLLPYTSGNKNGYDCMRIVSSLIDDNTNGI